LFHKYTPPKTNKKKKKKKKKKKGIRHTHRCNCL